MLVALPRGQQGWIPRVTLTEWVWGSVPHVWGSGGLNPASSVTGGPSSVSACRACLSLKWLRTPAGNVFVVELCPQSMFKS